MFLKAIAEENVKEYMEAWDEGTESFVPGAFRARVGHTDRFLSNFNKPLRRRMLFVPPEEDAPASGVFKVPSTGDIYLYGQRRGDSLDGKNYLNMVVAHLATDDANGSSGLAEIYRKTPTGPSNDPGWLVETLVGKTYADVEFRTSAREPDAYDLKIENYFAFIPGKWDLRRNDRISLHGVDYKVVDSFKDSGFLGLRVDREEDSRVDFVLSVAGSKTYDKVNHTYITTPVPYNVTGEVIKSHDFSDWLSESEPYIDVVVESDHIGIVPAPDEVTITYKGKTRTVTQVDTQPGERQYRLRCR